MAPPLRSTASTTATVSAPASRPPAFTPLGAAPAPRRRRWLWLSLLGLAAVAAAVLLARRGTGAVTVQTVRAVRSNVAAVVTASGEITPQTYADISPNNVGQITNLYVKEGDHVRAGQLLAKLWNVQQAASVAAMQAQLQTSHANLAAQRAAVGTAQANLHRDSAQLAQLTQDWRRTQALYRAQLVARSTFDAQQAAFKSAQAQFQLSQAALRQAQAQVHSLQSQIAQSEANLKAANDALTRTEFTSPLNGIVTYLPVHVGDTVVMGIQNSPGSVIMRVADMSVVTADVQVDETDIAQVKVGQPALITIDAFGDQTFPAHVTEVGDTAILRSTGAAATSTTGSDAQQAKDFKVVVQLNSPPANIRPGLSCTAKITTATAANAVVVPIQSIVEREPAAINPPARSDAVPSAAPQTQNPLQGVFVIAAATRTAVFRSVRTGVMGVDTVQVLSGVRPGDEVISGPYSALRTLANHAAIKVDNHTASAAVPPAG